MTKLALRQLTPKEADGRRWIGAGRHITFMNGEREGRIHLAHASIMTTGLKLEYLRIASGILAMTDRYSFLRLLVNAPVLPEHVSGEQGWYWDFLTQQLNDDLIPLLGFIAWSEAVEVDGIWLRVTITLEDDSASVFVCVPPTIIDHWKARRIWECEALTFSDDFPISLPLIVGQLRLSAERYQALTPGDVLLPSDVRVSVDGEGVIVMGAHLFHFELEPEIEYSHKYKLQITLHKGPETMTETELEQTEFPSGHEAEEGEYYQASTDRNFNDLPLELTIRCGNLSLTLGELQNLNAGSTLMVEHVTPGEALLCHGNYLLAKGELVNVNGALGLQIVSMLSPNVSGTS